jgi:type I restriction enzyme R subunit
LRERDDDTPLCDTRVNIKDWCKNRFEVIDQPRSSTGFSQHRYGVILLINGVPVQKLSRPGLWWTPRSSMI